MSIGQQLQEARKAQSLSIDEVAHATHIRPHYLEALESDNLEVFPSLVQVRGFLRVYASYLDLDSAHILAELDGEPADSVSSVPPQEPQPPAARTQEPDMGQAEAIFAEVGEKLSEHREVLGFSLKDVERQTHIRVHYLESLENGDLDGLPSPVQGRGMLSNYATFLGLEPDPILLRYADGLQARLAARQSMQREAKTPASHPPASRPSPLRRVFNTDLIVGSVLVVFLIAFTTWGALRISAMRAGNEPTPTSPSIAQVLLNSATDTATSIPTEPVLSETSKASTGVTIQETLSPTGESLGAGAQTITDTVSLPAVSEGPLQVSIIIRQRAWMRITIDGEIQFEGRVQPGSAYSFSGDERIEVLTGNGNALRLYFNQEDFGIIGSFGEVVNWIFTVEGMQTPTATLTPTGLPIPSATPTPPGGPASTPSPGP